MKKFLALFLALSMVFAMAGCSNTADDGDGASNPPASEGQQSTPDDGGGVDPSSLKMAMLIPGSPTDGGYCQLGAEAAAAIGEEFGTEVVVIEAATADKIKSEAETLADEGYDIIFGHGGEYASPFEEIGADYPDTWFVTSGGNVITENQFPVNITYEECTYVAGVLMALTTETNKIGMVVGGDFPAYTKTTRAMQMGAESVNPDIECMYAVLTSIDANEAYETTKNQINAGADWTFSNADAGTLGSLKAVMETDNVKNFGALADYSTEAPDHVVVSGICHYDKAYIAGVNAILEGIDEPSILFTGMADGSVTLVWNEALKADIPQEVMDQVDETIAKIESGEIHVPNEYE